jgi:hypothetical protein
VLAAITGMDAPQIIMNKVADRSVLSLRQAHKDQQCFRASSIGKPWILQILNRWFPSDPVFNVSTCMKMLDGVVAQAWLEEILLLTGHDFESERELILQSGDVKVIGHSDVVVTNMHVREKVVIECKSMAGHVFSKFSESPHDDYGYLSQLAFYTSMIQLENPTYTVEPVFVLFDRSRGIFKTIPIAPHIIDEKFRRIKTAVETVATIPVFDYRALLEVVQIPPPTGKQIPNSMKWSRWSNAFYCEGSDGNMRVRDKEDSIRLLTHLTPGGSL